MAKMSTAQVGADIGGTFTDILWRGADGELRMEKRLSQPDDYAGAVVDGIGDVCGHDGVGAVSLVCHATTVATNAVLEGTGARVGLVTTAGFRDVLEFGRLQRPDLYNLFWEKSPPLVPRERRVEVIERIAADGAVVTELLSDSIDAAIDVLVRERVEAVAVCLLNSYANPAHEHRVGEAIRRRLANTPVVLSTDLLREAGEYERSSTVVVNAYLLPVMSSYLRALVAGLQQRGCKVKPSIMQSSGGTIGADAAPSMPVRIVESGPAAGVIGAAALARDYGIERAISFDMGGTTAKACLIEHYEPTLSDEYWVGGALNREGTRLLRGSGSPIRMPAMDIAEVSSGGGSIAWIDDGGALKLGPHSAGADPGPACYGRGGVEPTFTDACVVLGILGRAVIGADKLRLRPEFAVEAIRTYVAAPLDIDVRVAAAAIYRVGISNLMRAIRAVTVDVGKDPSDFALIAFGGAGGMVAGALAHELGIERVVVPPLPGVFSALGLLAAPARRDAVRGVFRLLTPDLIGWLQDAARTVEADVITEMEREGHERTELQVRRKLELHYIGQSSALSIDWHENDWDDDKRSFESLRGDFAVEYERLHGHLRDDSELEVAALRVSVEAKSKALGFREIVGRAGPCPLGLTPQTRRIVDFGSGSESDAVVLSDRRALIDNGEARDLIVDEPDSTIFIPRTQRAAIDDAGTIFIDVRPDAARATATEGEIDASSLEIFRNWLATLNDELTANIARTAQSEIAKDTLDFATAICDAEGRVISQGLTMVLHAGSIPANIARVLATFGDDIRPGDAFLSNDPYLAGGSHLPDIYIVRPVFAAGERIGFAGAVCHVADMGGRVPGGNAADSREIFAEGLRLPPVRIVEAGRLSHSVESILRANVRVPEKVLGDMHSLLNACAIAERRLGELVAARGVDYFRRQTDAVVEHASALFRERIRDFPAGRHVFRDVLDDDGVGNGPITIQVAVERVGDRLTVDFAGSDPQVAGATNSPICFTESAAYYAIKAVLGPDIPDNSGYFDLIDVQAPPGTVVNPLAPTATGAKGVAAFRITDALFGALAQALPGRVPAAGDGGATIVALGGRRDGRAFVLVDIVMSAWGGRPDSDGLDGISSAASNGRNTPVEVIESAYPVRVLAYELIPDTGGCGRMRGGLATRRVYEYTGLEPATLQVRSDRNPTASWGLLGGHPGSVSLNVLTAPGADPETFPTKFTTTIAPGTVFEHATAGAGGYGPPEKRPCDLIRRDLAAGKLTPEAALRDYGFSLRDNEKECEMDQSMPEAVAAEPVTTRSASI